MINTLRILVLDNGTKKLSEMFLLWVILSFILLQKTAHVSTTLQPSSQLKEKQSLVV